MISARPARYVESRGCVPGPLAGSAPHSVWAAPRSRAGALSPGPFRGGRPGRSRVPVPRTVRRRRAGNEAVPGACSRGADSPILSGRRPKAGAGGTSPNGDPADGGPRGAAVAPDVAHRPTGRTTPGRHPAIPGCAPGARHALVLALTRPGARHWPSGASGIAPRGPPRANSGASSSPAREVSPRPAGAAALGAASLGPFPCCGAPLPRGQAASMPGLRRWGLGGLRGCLAGRRRGVARSPPACWPGAIGGQVVVGRRMSGSR